MVGLSHDGRGYSRVLTKICMMGAKMSITAENALEVRIWQAKRCLDALVVRTEDGERTEAKMVDGEEKRGKEV